MVLPHVASAVRSVVRAQLDALRMHDGERALSCSTPGRQRYGTPEQFLETIARTLPQLVYFRWAEFEHPHEVEGRVALPVKLTSADGRTHRAVYLLEEQPGGQWLIDQCLCAPPAVPAPPGWVC